jgi:hypothetical protein
MPPPPPTGSVISHDSRQHFQQQQQQQQQLYPGAPPPQQWNSAQVPAQSNAPRTFRDTQQQQQQQQPQQQYQQQYQQQQPPPQQPQQQQQQQYQQQQYQQQYQQQQQQQLSPSHRFSHESLSSSKYVPNIVCGPPLPPNIMRHYTAVPRARGGPVQFTWNILCCFHFCDTVLFRCVCCRFEDAKMFGVKEARVVDQVPSHENMMQIILR